MPLIEFSKHFFIGHILQRDFPFGLNVSLKFGEELFGENFVKIFSYAFELQFGRNHLEDVVGQFEPKRCGTSLDVRFGLGIGRLLRVTFEFIEIVFERKAVKIEFRFPAQVEVDAPANQLQYSVLINARARHKSQVAVGRSKAPVPRHELPDQCPRHR